MRQKIRHILSKNILKKALKICPLMLLMLSCLNGEQARSDSTFFPEDSAEADANEMTKESSDTIKEWAELKRVEKETAKLDSPKKEQPSETSASLSHMNTPETHEEQKEETATMVVVTPDSQPSLASEEQKPLQLTTVAPHQKALPVHEEGQAKEQSVPQKTILSYTDAANNRSPLGLLDPTKEVHTQRWYIYSSAIRGLKTPSDKVHVVSMEGAAPERGEEVQALLVEMGVDPQHIQLIHAKGEANQAGIIYIFAGK